jgi:hypothetical protein
MAYRAEISRASPALILFVIDQSTSMGHKLSGGQTKAEFLADVLNKTLYTIVVNCTKADGVRDYFEIGVISYSGTDARNGFRGFSDATLLQPISRMAERPLRVETRTRKVVGQDDTIVEQPVRFPVWFEPQSRGKTSMCAGLTLAVDVLQRWISNHPTAYPPTVLHVTDGHPTDGNPEPAAAKIMGLATEDGSCLLFNLHVDVLDGSPIVFPNDEAVLGDRFGRALFRMSSVLPLHAATAAKAKGYEVTPGSRAFVFNAGLEAIVDFFDIGTRPSVTTNVRAASDR